MFNKEEIKQLWEAISFYVEEHADYNKHEEPKDQTDLEPYEILMEKLHNLNHTSIS